MSQAGIINVSGQSGVVDSITGTSPIQANGVSGIAQTGNVIISIKQTFSGSLTTTDGSPHTLVTVPMILNPAVFLFQLQIVSFDVTDILGAAWQASCSFRTNGSIPAILGSEDVIIQDDVLFIGNVNLNGTPTAFNVIVTGQAGKTYDWVCTGSYIFVN